MTAWNVREATPGDREELARVEAALFADEGSLDASWLFDHNPAGKALVLVAAAPDGRVAGTRSILPWDVVADGRTVRLAQYARSWTLPEFRKQGASVAIGNALNRAAEERGFPLVFLFPSVRSIPGHRRIGNRIDTLLQRRQAVTSFRYRWAGAPRFLDGVLRLGQAVLRRGRAARRDWEPAPQLAGDAERVWAGDPVEPGTVHGVRDGSFVSWRYDRRTGRAYHGWRYPAGDEARLLAVSTTLGTRTKLVDVWGTAGPGEREAAVAGLLGHLAADCTFLEWCPPRFGTWGRVGGRVGLLARKEGVPLARWFVRKPEELGSLGDLERYQLTEGDSDYA